MTYLADTSAMIRIWRKQVDAGWHDIVKRGLIAICEPVLAETLAGVGAKQYVAVEQGLRAAYPFVTVPDGVWDVEESVRHDLVPYSAHQGLSVGDLVVAAAAIQLRMTVLHEDGDFETVARYVPELQQRRISTQPE